jgi:hypothetical protein
MCTYYIGRQAGVGTDASLRANSNVESRRTDTDVVLDRRPRFALATDFPANSHRATPALDRKASQWL